MPEIPDDAEARAKVNAWLRHLGAAARWDRRIELDSSGRCAFTYRGSILVTVLLPPGSPVVHVMAVLGGMPGEPEERARLMQQLLEWNYAGLETRGAVLSVEPGRDRIILGMSQSVAVPDPVGFVNVVGGLLSAAVPLRRRLSGKAEEDHPEASPASSSPLPFKV